MRATALVLLLSTASCVTRAPVEPTTACRMVQDNRSTIATSGPRDLYELAWGTPAEDAARGAWAQQITGYTLTAVGAAAVLAGLITGLATDAGTDTTARNIGYGLGGGALAIAVTGLILAFTMPIAIRRVRDKLSHYADRCH